MESDPRPAAFRRVRWARGARLGLAAVLALLGVLLDWDRLTDTAGVAADALAAATLVFGVGWLLLLPAAALALGLILSGSGGRTAPEWVGWLVSPKGRWVLRFFVAVGLLAWLVGMPEADHAAEPHRCRLELDEARKRTRRYETPTRLTPTGSVTGMSVYSDAIP
jgi:hypothetical protein